MYAGGAQGARIYYVSGKTRVASMRATGRANVWATGRASVRSRGRANGMIGQTSIWKVGWEMVET